jgi:hypothetical protein
MRYSGHLIGAFLTLALPTLGLAQTPPPNTAPVAPKEEQLDSTTCAPSDIPSTTGKGAPADEGKTDNRDLSEKLAQSGGVICPPPYADSEIRAPTPPGGAMPVIPPPGSPGGDQSVRPK